MDLVIDVSSIVPLAFSDEDQEYSEAVVYELANNSGYVPSLFWFEVSNVLTVNITKRSRITKEQANYFSGRVEKLQLTTAELPKQSALIELAIKYDLSAYDASYLELAVRVPRRLATLDEPLRKAARQAGVEVFEPE